MSTAHLGDGITAEESQEPVLLSLVAHELAQPLTSAKASALTLQARTGDETFSDETRSRLLETINRNLDQLRALLISLRMFSEIEAGQLEVETDVVDMRSVFEDAKDDFGTQRNLTTISFECDVGLSVDVDLVLFRQVLVNLIANAVKFCTPGSEIQVTAGMVKDQVLVRVANEGMGFPSTESERIFEKSVRLQPTQRGLGFGLFVAKEIVEAHHGRIWAESQPDEGASFYVSLPRHSNGMPNHPNGTRPTN